MSLNVGIVGFGRIGNEHAGWIEQTRSLRVAAVADATPARQKLAENRGFAVFNDIEALLANGGVEAVLISTPTAMHFDHASAALTAGKHVLVEKPMALDLDQSRKLVELAKAKGRVLSVFHNRRWDTDYLVVKNAVKEGRFGKLINVESRLGQWSSCVGPAAQEYRPWWRNESAFGGGGLYDWGSHFVDQMWRLLWPAKAVRVFAQLRGNVWTSDCDDFARVCIDFDNGTTGLVEINTTTMRPLPLWHIDGTAGSADAPFSLEFDLNRWAQLDFVAAGGSVMRLTEHEPRMSEADIWEHFAGACRGEGEPAIKANSALVTMMLLDAARESSASGRAVELVDGVQWVY